MRIVLVRHGEVAGNDTGIIVGASDVPLTERGRRQAAALAERFARDEFTVVYSSLLSRARETADIIASKHPGVPRLEDCRINERNFGVFEDRPLKELIAAEDASGAGAFNFRPKEGEAPADLHKRFMPFFDELFEKYHGKTVVLVSHSAIISAILIELLGFSGDRYIELKHANAGFSVLDCNDRTHKVLRVLNENKHTENI